MGAFVIERNTTVPKDYVIQTASTGNTRWSEEIIIPREDWIADAACTQTDPDAYFPEHAGLTPANRDAKKLCNTVCTVTEKCLRYAMDNDEQFGVWGGRSAAERANLRRKQEAATS